MRTTQRHFKPIPSLPGYEVSRGGKVRAIGGSRIYSTYTDPNGRLLCTIRHEDRPFSLSIARAVGEVYCPDFAPGKRPLFLDGKKSNCRVRNLSWVTVSEYYRQHPRTTAR